jgi:hypothetical protein
LKIEDDRLILEAGAEVKIAWGTVVIVEEVEWMACIVWFFF